MPPLTSPTGVVGDPRQDPKVQSGWDASELAASAPAPVWRQKTSQELRAYEIWNQDGSSACVAFSKAKQLSIEIKRLTGEWLPTSPASIYQLRSNRPGLGMILSDANDIVNKRGATLECLMRSQNLTEAQIDAVPRTKVADLIGSALGEAVVSYMYPGVDIEKVAQQLEAGKSVSLMLFADFDEYGDTPTVLKPALTWAQAQIRHEVVAVDYFLHPALGKCLLIEDSWGVGHGLGGRRTFTKDFFDRRVIITDFLATFSFDGGAGVKPRFDESVVSWQRCLQWEGLFPADVEPVEVFGPLTRAGTAKFQVRYGISPAAGNLGPITRAKARELYP